MPLTATPTTTSRRLVVRLGCATAAVALLSACGAGQSGADPAPTATSAPSTSTGPSSAPSSSEPGAAPSSAAESSAPAGKPVAASGACKVISASEMEKIVDVELGEAKSQDDEQGSLCTYAPTQGGRTAVVALAGPSEGSLRSQAKTFEERVPDGKVSDIEIAGTDEALTLSGKASGVNTVVVIARKGEYVFGAILASPKSAGDLRDAGTEIVTTMLEA